MNKHDLRAYYLNLRRKMSRSEVMEKSNVIAALFFERVNLENVKVIHCFLPISKNNEVDTWAIIKKIWKEYPDIKVVVPVSDFESAQMAHVLINEETTLVKNNYGIPEPISKTVFSVDEIDLVITPLLVVDSKLNRIGYGGGFYDRFFYQLPNSTKKIGIGFFKPFEAFFDVENHDIKLDAYIHPHL